MSSGVALAAGLACALVCAVAAWFAAPSVARLARDGAGRWWLRRWPQAVAVGAVTAGIALTTPVQLWPGLLLGFGAAVLACLVDAASHRLPDLLTLRLGGAALVLVTGGAATLTGWRGVLSVLVGTGLVGGVLLLLALAHPAGMGLGDVKLGGLLGGLVGGGAAASLGAAVSAGGTVLVLAFLLGGLWSLVLLLLRRLGRRDHVPFGPFLLCGALLALTVAVLPAR